ncbi:rRNA maturation RNase YbeY [Crocosphaera sp. UHCC 0190]|uniref:rRNA maturation RNase YbeY n=1 Tax=Crocosphaera sp. UHCC 0190 TaxID=3110246 RepID=UPI002B1F1531|nr:rRNA maturation RNase YbeY [Crocosphaera sp. UHCC 0190]MEA5511720.1 rRNA maturation RNase YbeY [Crocosphaera sp. UHCC 0190]
MISSEPSSIVIDVNIQDVFTAHSSDIDDNLSILSDQWQHWFNIWGESLVSYLPSSSSYELSLRLTGDAEIQSLNAQYRQKDQPTDVLAFAALEVDFPIPEDGTSEIEPLYLGDIVISIETANRQAQQQNHSLNREVAWLVAHGFLHLLGWDHPDDETLEEMLQQQETLLKSIGLGGQPDYTICSN